MRKYLLFSCIALLTVFNAFSQDFSNKGKDFWVGYGYHAVMINGGNAQDMYLYFATDQVTTITVTIPGLSWTRTYTSGAGNNIITSDPMPKNSPDARLTAESTAGEDKGIHITANHPIVAYAHVLNMSASGATILYPTPTLGKEYYSVNYTNISNGTAANCWFNVIATDPGTTTVEITPSNTTINHTAGVPFTVNLTQGQVYNIMSAPIPAATNQWYDLTGSKIQSVSSGTGGCKRIAVFSGSGRISITCNGSSSSSDNYMVQALPKSTWGKNYLTMPTAAYGGGAPTTTPAYNIYRVCVLDPTTQVTIDGVLTSLPLQGNFYYEMAISNTKHSITADKPIMVAQYLTSTGACGNVNGDGDPEVIYLSPIEQSISTVTWNACNKYQIAAAKHYLNVVIPNGGTAISSFKLDGITVPAANFIVHPRNANYSTLILNVSGSTSTGVSHTVTSDSGFNAIAYGYGSVESYGYNAGTNVKDLYTQAGTTTPYATVAGAACANTSFQFKISLPYKPDSIYWDLTSVPNNLPLFPYGLEKLLPTLPATTLTPDSSTTVGGRTVWWYALPTFYTFNVPGSYDVPISAFSPTGDCGTQSDYTLPLVVSAPPTASFSYTAGGCVAEPYTFTETTPQIPYPTYLYNWDFGDPGSGANNIATTKVASHTFSTPGSHIVKFTGTTTGGCISSQAQQTIVVPDLPTATISGTTSVCVGSSSAPQITFTGTQGTPGYTFSYNINGVPQTPVQTIGIGSTVSVNASTATPGPLVYQLTGVKNTGSTLCTTDLTAANLTATVTVDPNANVTYTSGNIAQTICVNTAITPIVYDVINGSGGAVTGLPNGVTGIYDGTTNQITISGTPTVSGTFNYSVSPSGTCFDPAFVPLTGTIIVSADATIVLQTANNTQTVCVNNAIANIQYLIGGGATGVTVTGLPTGVTFSTSGNIVTITGAPTAPLSTQQTYNYSIATVSTCINPPPLTGTIIVNPNTTLTLISAPATTSQSLCVNIPIADIKYQVGDGGTLATLTGTLPTGVTGVYDVPTRIFTISGTPTASGTLPFNYTISASGTCTLPPSLSGSITVNPDATLSVASGTPVQTVCINKPIVSIIYNITGGGTNVVMTGTFPPGVTGTYSGGVYTIQGTPTVASATPYHYSISTTGTCVQAGPLTGDITVNPNAAIALNAASGATTQGVCINTPIAAIKFDVTGNATAVNVTPALPAGLTGVYSGGSYTISGTATVSSVPAIYTITVSGTCDPATATINLSINPDATLTWNTASGATTQTICINKAIVPIIYNIGGGGTNIVMTGTFPPGVTGTYSGGIYTIQGTPTVASATPYHYSISTTGSCVQAGPLTGDITVNPDAAIALNATSGATTQAVCINTAIAAIKFDVTGNATAVNISPALPAGLTGVYSGGTYTISGTPTVSSAAATYTITASGTCDPATATVSLAVNPDATLAWDNASGATTQTICINNPIVLIRYNIGGGGTNISMTGTFPPGVTGTYSAGVYTIQGSPTAASATPYHYSISTTGTCLQAGPLTGDITVNPDAAIALSAGSAATTQSICINTTMGTIRFNVTGNATAVAIAPALPAGLTGVYSGGIYTISGTASATSIATTYTITATGTCGPATATINLTVNDATALFSYAKPFCEGNAASFTDLSTSTPGITLNNTVWDLGDGSPLENHAPGSTFTHLFPGVTTYTVKMYATSASGCNSAVTQQQVKVNPIPRPNFTVDNSFYCLPNATVVFNPAPSTIADAERLTFTWDFGDPASGNNSSIALTPSHFYSNVGPYNVKLEARSDSGCVHDTVIVINSIHPQPKASYTVNKASVCLLDDAVFTDNTNPLEGTTVAWNWDFHDGTTASTKSYDKTFISADTFDVSLYITNSIGCNSDTLHKPFAVYDFPKVNAGDDRTVLEGGSVTMAPTVSGQDLQYLWSPSKYLNNPTLEKPTASIITEDITYRLTVTGIGGCPRFDDMFIKVLKFPTIPNTFSPNGDIYNPTWRIKYLESYPDCHIQVFTRTGQIVYEVHGYSDAKAWDGTLNGKALPVDTYYYIIEPGNHRDPITGYVTLLK